MKILFLTSTRIGDAVLSTGLLSHLVTRYPNAEITVACGPLPAPMFNGIPGVKRIIPIKKLPLYLHWLLLWHKSISTFWDIVVDLRASALAWVLFTRDRKIFKSRKSSKNIHRVVELTKFFGLEKPLAPRLWLTEKQLQRANELVPLGDPVIGLGVTANWLPKIWPPENFVELVHRLTKKDGLLPNARVAVFSGPKERLLAESVIKELSTKNHIDLAGKHPLEVAAACISKCELFIGNDSGIMHIAAALGIPTMGLFGPSPAKRYGPWGRHCGVAESKSKYDEIVSAPSFDHKKNTNLMRGLSVEIVERELYLLWKKISEQSDG